MSFLKTYNEHKDLVYNLALQYTQNTADAEEISQDVFVKVHQKMHTFNELSALKTWIYRITINQSLDFIRAKKRNKRSFFLGAMSLNDEDYKITVAHFDHPGVLMENKEGLTTLFRGINQLPENQKTVIILLKIEQKTQAETAQIMDTSVKAIESLFQRAKKNLASILHLNEGKK